jgi:hypothetical protein
MLAGIFMGWFFIAVGAVIFLVALRGWIADASDQFQRLRRRQELTSAVIPATPMRRAARR